MLHCACQLRLVSQTMEGNRVQTDRVSKGDWTGLLLILSLLFLVCSVGD